MSIEVTVPNLPESVSDATIAAWHKKPGDTVNKNDSLVDLETDKVVLEVTAPETGVLTEVLAEQGAIVLAGQVIGVLDTAKREATATPAAAVQDSAASTNVDTPLSPSVRRLINENTLNPADIKGTGKSGRLTKSDVLEHIQKQSAHTLTAAEPQPQSQPAQAEPEVKPAAVVMPETTVIASASLRPEQRVPMTRLRAKIAERLLQAQQNAAMLTTFNEVNMQYVIDLRNQYKTRFEQKHNVKLGFMSFFVKASVEALKRFPAINASIDGNDIIYHGYYDLGIAVSTPRGLIVPVLHDADQLDFAGIEKSIVEFGEKARAGTLSYDDLKGGTFTITNGGVFGSMLSTPILNPPQCAILGMHAIKERPVVENGQIVIRPIMYLALSYDHRLVDGREAVQFLVTIKECLEAPAHLLLNI